MRSTKTPGLPRGLPRVARGATGPYSRAMQSRERELLDFIYGRKAGGSIVQRLDRLMAAAFASLSPPRSSPGGHEALPLTQGDAFLITYGDQLKEPGVPPLRTLSGFVGRYLAGSLSGVHILPFFPSTSDDGFSVSDYASVDAALGGWGDIEAIAGTTRLMADLVLNHCSASHPWFAGYLAGDRRYRDYFISVPPTADLSAVVRPRALPLLTTFAGAGGPRRIWTTFSADQVDLNYANPEVLLEMVRILFSYVRHGVQVVRLDAVAYVWKEIGHPCIHHPKTHAVVKLLRALLGRYAPWVVLVTETNVPHEENLSYFGDGSDEAQMVYQFALPPLVLDAFLREDAGHLRQWAESLPPTAESRTYFNFLASHDGVGLLPARGILTEGELAGLIESVRERGGLVSYKATPDGEVPYELNVSYRDAVAEPGLEPERRARKFLASQAVLLSLAGVPGIYVHSLIGSGNWREGVERTGHARSINREKLAYAQLAAEFERPGSLRNLIFEGFSRMLRARRRPAFHPGGAQVVLPAERAIFALERTASDGSDRVLCAVNTSGRSVKLAVEGNFTVDLLGGGAFDALRAPGPRQVSLAPWQAVWLARESDRQG